MWAADASVDTAATCFRDHCVLIVADVPDGVLDFVLQIRGERPVGEAEPVADDVEPHWPRARSCSRGRRRAPAIWAYLMTPSNCSPCRRTRNRRKSEDMCVAPGRTATRPKRCPAKSRKLLPGTWLMRVPLRALRQELLDDAKPTRLRASISGPTPRNA